MKRFGTGIAIVFGLLVLCFTALVAVIQMQPSQIAMERSVTIAATPADLVPQVRDFKNFVEWSPWSELDPDATRTFSDPSAGPDAWYAWDGNDDVGAGKMTVIADEANKVVHALDFTRPFESHATATLAWATKGEEQIEVTWGFETEANFVLKAINFVAPLEDALGKDYERGLGYLKPRVEEAAAKRREAEAEAEADEAEEGEADEG